MIKLNIMNKNEKLQNYINFQKKFNRMNDIVSEWQVEYAVEKFKPLMDDGFDGNDIIEYFTVKLIDYIENKYEPNLKKINKLLHKLLTEKKGDKFFKKDLKQQGNNLFYIYLGTILGIASGGTLALPFVYAFLLNKRRRNEIYKYNSSEEIFNSSKIMFKSIFE